MELKIQIYSFIVSFFFGCVFEILLDLFNKGITKLHIVLKILLSFLFVIMMAGIYFLILLWVNNGVVHIYFMLSILVGYIFVYKISVKLFTHLRKK